MKKNLLFALCLGTLVALPACCCKKKTTAEPVEETVRALDTQDVTLEELDALSLSDDAITTDEKVVKF